MQKTAAWRFQQRLIAWVSLLAYFGMKYGLNDISFPFVAVWKGIWVGIVFYLIATALVSGVFYCIYQNAERVLHATRAVHKIREGDFGLQNPKGDVPRFCLLEVLNQPWEIIFVPLASALGLPIGVLCALAMGYIFTQETLRGYVWELRYYVGWAMHWHWTVMLVIISTQFDPMLATIYTLNTHSGKKKTSKPLNPYVVFSIAFVVSTSYSILFFVVVRGILFR